MKRRKPRRRLNKQSRRTRTKRKIKSKNGLLKRTRKTVRGRKPALVKSQPGLETALKLLRAGNTQAFAARTANVSIKRFRSFVRKNKLARFKNRRWVFGDRRRRRVVGITTRGELAFFVRGFDAASRVMSHRNAVRTLLDTNNALLLLPFSGESVLDTRGRRHRLETDPNKLYRLAAAGDDTFEQVYRIVG